VGHRRDRSRKRRFRVVIDIPWKFGTFKQCSQSDRIALDGKAFERRASEISGINARFFDPHVFDTRRFVGCGLVAFEQRKESYDDARQNIGVWRNSNFGCTQGALDRFRRCEVPAKLSYPKQRRAEGRAWHRISFENQCPSWTRCRVSLANFGQDDRQRQGERRRGRQPPRLSSSGAFLELKASQALV
jgi:hypothetical protein